MKKLKIKKDKNLFSLEYQSNEKIFPIFLLIFFLLLAVLVAILLANTSEQFNCLNNFINRLSEISHTRSKY